MSNSSWSNDVPRRLVVEVGTDFSGLFFYDPVPAAGNLVGSWAVSAGTDPYGNSYPAGISTFAGAALVGNWNGNILSIGPAGSSQINLVTAAGETTQTFITGNPATREPTTLQASLPLGIGASGYEEWDLQGPEDSTNKEIWFLTLRSASPDGSQRGQAIIRLGHPLSVGAINVLLCDFAGGHLLGNVTAVTPGTGTPGVPLTTETWHTATVVGAGWTNVGANQPLRYRREGIAGGTVRLSGELLTTGAGPWPASTTLVSLGSNYAPTQSTPFVTRSDIAVAAGNATVNVLNTGNIQNGQTFTAAGQRLFFDGITYPVD